ncbi:PepSY-like domain-containing protein [Zobellia barbeyronii]|uniref:PepSY-like domain-containing protein n=1 Tax=Zobellia barbeyronii TaxID=2748009 RepID=A0ABS5WJD1_9FLAO|nr:PepSY-like domain-containing protein [Zobellia barbeyronii]MBT2162307.1 PepSY-like domain-containing protein [Zobellia barbeyronii]
MNKQILSIGVALLIGSIAQAQDIPQSQVPSIIVNKFNKEFPKASDIEWEMDGNLYNVDFEMGWNKDHDVWYNAEGDVVKHKEEIAKSELPKAVKDRIKTDFKGYSVDDLERITDNDKVVYKLELDALTQQDWDAIIDADGNLISKIED